MEMAGHKKLARNCSESINDCEGRTNGFHEATIGEPTVAKSQMDHHQHFKTSSLRQEHRAKVQLIQDQNEEVLNSDSQLR